MDDLNPSPIPWSDYLNGDFDDEPETFRSLPQAEAGSAVELASINAHSPGRRDEPAAIDSSLQRFSPPEESPFYFSQQISQLDREASTQPFYIDHMQLTEGGDHVLDCESETCTAARLPPSPTEEGARRPSELLSSRKSYSLVPQKRRKVFSRDARLKVREWLDSHADCPYPSTEEKAHFAQEFDLTLKQVSGLFNNMRRRSSTANQSPTKPSTTSSLPIMISKGCEEQTPIKRYLSSSPEEDPQPIEVVANAAATFKRPRLSGEREDVRSPPSKKQRFMIRQNGEKSGHSPFSVTSTLQESSKLSSPSVSSCTSGKRGKRRITTSRPSTSNVGHYWCTTCWKNFTSCGSWRRHEQTVCNPQRSFECRVAEITPTDAYCGACLGDSGCQRLFIHYYKACQHKAQEARTFSRRDQFQNHLFRIHNAVFTPIMESWVHPASSSNGSNDKRSRCGFCGTWFLTWEQRLDHIGNHYRSHNKVDRSKWQPAGEDEGCDDIGDIFEEKQKDGSNGSISAILTQQSVRPVEILPLTNSVVPQASEDKMPHNSHGLKESTDARDSLNFIHPPLRRRFVIPPGSLHRHDTYSTSIGGTCKSDFVSCEITLGQGNISWLSLSDPWGY